MKWISNLYTRYWRNAHFILVAILSLLLILGGDRFTGVVSGAAVRVFYYPFFVLKSTVSELTTVNRENRRLHEELASLSSRSTRLEEFERENERLRAILGFEPPPGYSLLPAMVVSVAGDQMPQAAVINRGADDSIMVDQPLINEQGLIGRVVSISKGSAVVQLLTDPTHRVAVRVAASRDMGIVKYRISEGMILDNFPVQGRIQSGDMVISSGLGGIYPPGLVVGTVTSVERPEDGAFCRVRLKPAANFNSLEELFVLRQVAP